MHLLTIGPPSLITQLLLGQRGSVDYELMNNAPLVRYHGQICYKMNPFLMNEGRSKREVTSRKLCLLAPAFLNFIGVMDGWMDGWIQLAFVMTKSLSTLVSVLSHSQGITDCAFGFRGQ